MKAFITLLAVTALLTTPTTAHRAKKLKGKPFTPKDFDEEDTLFSYGGLQNTDSNDNEESFLQVDESASQKERSRK